MTLALGWARALGCTGADSVNDVVVTATGETVLVATFSGGVDLDGQVFTAAGGTDVLVAVLSPTGSLVRARVVGGPGNDSARGVGLRSDGQLVVAGQHGAEFTVDSQTLGHAGGADIFVLRLDDQLVAQDAAAFGSTSTDTLLDAAVNPSGQVALTGSLFDAVDFGNGPVGAGADTTGFLVVLEPDFTFRWARSFGGTGSDDGTGAALDGSGNALLAGTVCISADLGGGTLTANTCSDGVAAGYSNSGTHQFSRMYGGGGIQEDGMKVAFDAAGNAYWTGIFTDTVDFGGGPRTVAAFYDAALVSFTAAGVYRWDRIITGSGSKDILALVGDANGVIMAGAFTNSINAGQALSTASRDGFISAWDPDGNNRFARAIQGPGTQYALGAAAVAGSLDVVVVGSFEQQVTLTGGQVLTSQGAMDGYVWRLRP